MKNDYNVILDQLMEKISKAVADEQYAEVILYNEELCKAVVEMTESCSEEDKESLYNLISDARDEIDGLKDEIYQAICDAYILKYQPGEDIGIDDVEITDEFVSEEG